MMKKLLAVMTLATMVTGCATGIQGEKIVGRPGSPMWFSTASVPTQIAHFKQICSAYGFNDSTLNMSQCLRSEMQTAKQRAHENINSSRSTATVCQPWLNGIRCVEQ
jgi:hypothetical protein